jgi:fumarylacetoacetase
MIPLGPFNGKNFGTSLSPWVVTVDALSPFQTKGPPQEPPIASYLVDSENGTYSVDMEVELLIGEESTTVTKSNTDVCYWNIRQMITHVVSAGSGLRTGDLIAIGTISGPERASVACLMEYTEGGKNPLELPGGMKRAYLEDGDIVRITAIAGGGESGVGFGECIGQLLPSRQLHTKL